MIRKTIGVSLALLCLSQASLAQDLTPKKHVMHRIAEARRDTLDAGAARLAMKATFQPSAQPTQQELLTAILLMSLRDHRASHI
ncbi:MAG TPA: hypothetical protein VMF58_14205 [Rhizomicrobium sp.]|nr:hypothetical protein [Rhizomicrobium sp.]